MKTYAIRSARTKLTGHIRQDGTRLTYCNKPIGIPNGDFMNLKGWKMCTRCVRAEAKDRAEAVAVAVEHLDPAPTARRTDPVARVRRALAATVTDLLDELDTADQPEPEPSAPADHCGARRPGWGPGIGRHRLPCVLAPHTTGNHHDALGNTWPAEPAEPIADTEARLAAELVTEAEATDGTWRGQWIGQSIADGALFSLTPDREQGALFA